jgi:hypothetical protein
MGYVVNAMPWPLYPWEKPGTHCIGGWVGPRAALERCGKSCPHRDLIPNMVVVITIVLHTSYWSMCDTFHTTCNGGHKNLQKC